MTRLHCYFCTLLLIEMIVRLQLFGTETIRSSDGPLYSAILPDDLAIVGVGFNVSISINSPHPTQPNPTHPRAAYMRQWSESTLVQIMACRLFGAKPLSKPTVGYCQLDPKEQTSVKFWSQYKTFHSRKCIWKCRLRNGDNFVQEKS